MAYGARHSEIFYHPKKVSAGSINQRQLQNRARKPRGISQGMNGPSAWTARLPLAFNRGLRKTFTYRLYPSQRQQRRLEAQLEERRWLYNEVLAARRCGAAPPASTSQERSPCGHRKTDPRRSHRYRRLVWPGPRPQRQLEHGGCGATPLGTCP